jgi:hypothetical protein
MVPSTHGPHGQGPSRRPPAGAGWQEERVASLEDALGVMEELLRALAGAGYDGPARGRVRQVMEEAVRGALGPGGPRVVRLPMRVSYRVAHEYAVAEVEGRGEATPPPPVQGPHRQTWPGSAAQRFYTWLRCDRADGRVQACRCWYVP